MTNTHSTSSHAPEQMAEPDHVDIGSIIRYAVGLAAITGISMLAMYFTYQGMASSTDATHAVRAYPIAVDEDSRRPPEPRLQGSNATNTGNIFEQTDHVPTPKQALAALRAEEEAILNNYAWVDRNAAVVRLPIADAMKLRLQQGLEARPAAGAATPAPAPAAAEPAKEQGK